MTRKVKATVEAVELEGGFWGLIDEEGNQYEVIDMPKEFQQKGLTRTFTIEEVQQISFRMWGQPVRIVS